MSHVIVMGVSGCGKTTFGEALAERLDVPFIEGDRLHPAENVRKMSAGIPLDDGDRWPWLAQVAAALAAEERSVGSCSALKRVYRDRLRQGVGDSLRFVCLVLPRAELERRMTSRQGHFMPAGLLDSQLAAFETPVAEDDVLMVDGMAPLGLSIAQVAGWLQQSYWEERR
jgi:gluconokinase